ncbi:MAG TPA: PAS domain S-box protein, partial [Stenomitos sp.]
FTTLDSVRDESGKIIDFVWTYVNPKAAEILKRPIEELLGQRLLQVLPGNKLNSELFDRYVQIVETGEPQEMELPYAADGITGWFRNMAVKLRDGVSIVFSDITDRKRAEEDLIKTKNILQAVVNGTDDVIFVKDLQGRYVLANQATAQWVNKTVETLLGQDDTALFPVDEAQRIQAVDQRVIQSGESIVYDEPLFRRGELRSLLSRKYPWRNAQGEVVGVIGVSSDITERKIAEQALRENEQRFITLAQASPVIIFQLNTASECTYINSRWRELTGHPEDVALGMGWVETLHPEERDHLIQAWQQWRQNPQPQSLYQNEGRIICSNGSTFWYYIQALPLFDGGTVAGYIGTLIDITKRKQSEEALRENEQLLRLALTGAQAGSWDWEFTTGRVAWSPENYMLHGIDPATPVSYEVWYNTIHPDDRESINQKVLGIIEQRQSEFRNEFRILHPQRGLRWILGIGQLMLDEQGHPLRMSGINLDITERKQIEKELYQSEERYRCLVEITPQLTWITDAQGNNTYASQQMCDYLGLSFPELMNLNWQNIIHPDDLDRVLSRWMYSVQTGIPYEEEYRLRRADGIYRWHLVRAIAFHGEQETQWFGACWDISDRKQSEEILRRTAERDAFRVALTDALRSLDDPIEIQATASRILGQYLDANRVLYFEVNETCYFIAHDYVNGAQPLRGEFPIHPFGSSLITAYRAGLAVCVTDVATDPSLSTDERSAYVAIQIAAHIGVPLVKHGELVAGLAIHSKTPRSWTPEEVSLAEEVAERTWAAVERARAEAALRVSHNTFRHLVENSPFGVYVVDADFRLAQVSTGAQKVFASVRPLLGRDFAEVMRILWPETFANEAIAHFRHTLETGEPYHAPNTVERRHDTNEVESYDWKIERIALPDGR